MKYASTVIKGLNYDVNKDQIIITMYGKTRSWKIKELDQCIAQCQNPQLITEINRIMDAYKYIHTKRKSNLSDKVNLMKMLNIQYGELQTKLLRGELSI